jgi:hypothetical protein
MYLVVVINNPVFRELVIPRAHSLINGVAEF